MTSQSTPDCASSFPPQSRRTNYVPRILEWIDACNSSHGDTCVAKPISQRPQNDVPLWLIDTQEQCIVPGSSADRYLALSYTWPETGDNYTPSRGSLLLDAASIADLQTPQCFSSTAILGLLPEVIKHAMRVTVALGERYLWVDRLCIIQNDVGTVDQVMRMDKIYAGAYLTIIAAAPDVMYQNDQASEWPCFDAIFNHSVSSQLTQNEISQVTFHRKQVVRASRWATRGWTYQEEVLCHRAVIFTERGILWFCEYSLWDGEDLKPGQDYQPIVVSTKSVQRFASRWWPDFDFYTDLICSYNGREFSYPQDALLGISGILSALSKSFPGKFVSGVPTMFLDHVLLWQPFETAERRIDRDKISGASGNVSSLPSWAWCGWQCLVDPRSFLSGIAYIDDKKISLRARSWQTRNLVEWRMSNDRVHSELILEAKVFDEYVKLSSSPDALLPENWHSRYAFRTKSLRFSHAKNRKIFFKHPIPLPLDAQQQPKLCRASYLVFQTKTVMFLPAAVMRPGKPQELERQGAVKISVLEDGLFSLGPSDGRVPPVLVLQQPNGMFGGLLRLMDHDGINPNEPVELIAISTGSVKATDLGCSFEWVVFSARQAGYSRGNEARLIPFGSPPLTRQQKRAMLFDMAMVFDEEAAKGAGSNLWPELDARDAEVHSQVESKMAMHHEELAQLDGDEDSVMALQQEIWYEVSRTVLAQRHRDKAASDPSYAAVTRRATHHFYNVLWIQRRDGVAYRVACGWVPKHIWEAHAKGPVDVMLG